MAMVRRNTLEDRNRGSDRVRFDYYDGTSGANGHSNISMKLIGGRQIPVLEKNVTINQYYGGSRVHQIKPIAEKPNHLDPRIHGDDPSVYYNKDMQTPAYFKRPDSKDVVRGQLKALPAIQLNRTRNDMSTVFEAEPWIRQNVNPPLASDTEYTQNYFPGREQNQDLEMYRQSGGGNFVSEYEKHQLLSLVPRNAMLPVDSIKLTKEQELSLYKLICNDLHRFNPEELRDIYVECSRWDKNLEGYCSLEVLDDTLQNHRAYMPDTLRITSAQFVDTRRPGYVNYEKVLSFIGYALNLSENGQLFKTGSMHQDREVAKLLRTIEQELSKNSYSLDWTKWQDAFQKIDREYRGTLSAAQIKDICFDQHLPLSDSLVNKMLHLCDNRHRDGQYRWQDFLIFLDRLRPANIGFQATKRDESPRREHQGSLPKEKIPDDPNVRDRESNGRDKREKRRNDSYRDGYRQGGDRGDVTQKSRNEQINHLSYQINDLEKKYQITKDGIAGTDKPWRDRFILMAQALYNSDTANKGSLPRKEIMDIVRQYNTALSLDLDMNRIDMITISPENLDKSGSIILRAFLNRISKN